MNTWTKPFAALLLVLGSVWFLEPRASAQLGSLVVTISSPTPGSTVTGTTTASAQVTIVGMLTVSQVQFKLDGANLGAADTSAPYSIAWDTRTASNGSHTLTAVARDALGISWTSQAVGVTVFNDLTPPSVTLTSPASGASLRGTIAIVANASDNVGVTGVQFKLDGANLGAEDTTGPHSLVWNTALAANGSHVLTAVARDAAGNTTTAASVTVTVDNNAPAVNITSPAAGATVSGSTTVTANASDNIAVAGVQFLVDGAPLGAEDLVAPYTAAWNTTTANNGSHVLTATARDAAGNSATSAAVSVTVLNDATPPTVAITSPASGATVSASVAVTAAASDNVAVAGVQFLVDGVALGAEDTTAPYSVAWDTTTAAEGSHTLTAVARDGANHSTTSTVVSVTVTNQVVDTVTRVQDSSPAIVYTAAGTWIEGYTGPYAWSGGTAALGFSIGQRATLTFTGTGVSWIGFRGPQTGIANVYLDGTLVATVDPYNPTEVVGAVLFTVSGLAHGSHTLAIDVTRTRNEAANDYFVVVDAFDVTAPGAGGPVDATPPAISVTSPADASTVSGQTMITAAASDNIGVAGVTFFVDGVQVGAEDTTAPYELAWQTTTATNGAHALTASARDAAGNTTTSAPVSVTVSNTAPPPSPAATRFEDTEELIIYKPGTPAPGQPDAWFHGSRSREWSNSTSSFNRSAGARDLRVHRHRRELDWLPRVLGRYRARLYR